jgi:hypothetical protein
MLALVMIEISTCLSAFEYKQRLASVKHMLVHGALDGENTATDVIPGARSEPWNPVSLGQLDNAAY